jgi:hypothetical protein
VPLLEGRPASSLAPLHRPSDATDVGAVAAFLLAKAQGSGPASVSHHP